MNKRIKNLLNQKARAYNRGNRGEYEKLRKDTKKAIRNAKKNMENSIAKERKPNPRKFFNYVKGTTKQKDTIGPLRNENNELIVEDTLMAELLNQFFSSVFTEEDLTNIPDAEQLVSSEESVTSMNFTMKLIEEKIHAMKRNGAPGPLLHYPRLLQDVSKEISYPLSLLFKTCMEDSYCPEDWRISHITPIYKRKGSKAAATNYRPVSLTSCICKVMEACIKSEIVNHLEEKDLVRPSQHGFRTDRSCLTNLLQHLEVITKSIDEGKNLDVLYLDFSKAFDVIPHRRLLINAAGGQS